MVGEKTLDRQALERVPMASGNYDVFVSYSSKDTKWVHGTLIVRLQAAGLSVAYDKAFGAGGKSRANIDEKIDASRHVILVLSPDWARSRWAVREYVRAGAGDPDGSGKRVLPLLRKSVTTLPEGVRDLSYDDCTDAEKALAAIQRTIATIRSTANGAVHKCPDHECEALRRYQDRFEAAQRRISLLSAYKAVHDQLHELQLKCYVPIIKEIKTPPDETATLADAARHALLLSDDVWENLDSHAANLADVMGALRRVEEEQPVLTPQLAWIKLLERAHAELIHAITERAIIGVQKSLDLMHDALENQPVFNKGLVENARAIDLPDLLHTIDEALEAAQTVGTSPKRLQEIENAANQIRIINETLADLVADHDRWQMADAQLRRIERMLKNDVAELLENWKDLRQQISELDRPGEDRVENMQKTATGIDQAVAALDEGKLRRLFTRYREDALIRFFHVDKRLKQRCEELHIAGVPLAAIARIT